MILDLLAINNKPLRDKYYSWKAYIEVRYGLKVKY